MTHPTEYEATLAATTEAGAVAELARQAAHGEPIDLNAHEIRYAVGRDGRFSTFDFEAAADNPRRHRGTVQFFDVESFSRYVLDQTDGESVTRVYADPVARKIVAVIDDDGAAASWRDYRAHLVLRPSDAWQRWAGNNGKLLPQDVFAEHVKDSLIDIVSPSGATMYEVAESLEATTAVEFKSHQRLQTGEVKFTYAEQQNARAGERGELDIPRTFTLGLAPWYGLDPVEVHAELRWRITPGGLAIGYKLLELDLVIEGAFAGLADDLRATGLDVYAGVPADPTKANFVARP